MRACVSCCIVDSIESHIRVALIASFTVPVRYTSGDVPRGIYRREYEIYQLVSETASKEEGEVESGRAIRGIARELREKDKASRAIVAVCSYLAVSFRRFKREQNLRQYITRMAECIDHRGILSDAFLKRPSNLHLPPSPPIANVITDIFFEDEVDNIDYHFEAARLESFKKWPVEFMRPERLTAAGFYYTGDTDKVKCFECRVEISQWLPDDDPMVDHQRWSGRCRFIRDIPCGNVPIGVDPSTIPPPVPKGRDVCGPYDLDYYPNSDADTNLFNNIRDTVKSSLESCIPKNPKHPELANYRARLSTFDTWPISLTQTKEQLATAGFFYTGNGDQTLCYHCGGGLKDWEPEDDPWEQHAKWFSKCYYLLTVQGQEYVNRITGKSYNKQETSEQSATGNSDEKRSSQISIGSQDSGFESLEPCAGSSEVSNDQVSTVKLHHSKSNDDARMCKICYNRELRKVFVPCGHLIACTECAKNMKICAVCRKPVIQTVQAIIS